MTQSALSLDPCLPPHHLKSCPAIMTLQAEKGEEIKRESRRRDDQQGGGNRREISSLACVDTLPAVLSRKQDAINRERRCH